MAEEWAVHHDNVDYFPSYEIVMNSVKTKCWAEDKRHVRGEVVGYIMERVLDELSGRCGDKPSWFPCALERHLQWSRSCGSW